MIMGIAGIKSTLEKAFIAQVEATAEWHKKPEPEYITYHCQNNFEQLEAFVVKEHLHNFKLWHVEDKARRVDVDDRSIAECKRAVDLLNQQRNDTIEKIDGCLIQLLTPFIPQSSSGKHNTETPGMAIDRLSILSLKIFHMDEQTQRSDVDNAHKHLCIEKRDVLTRQRIDLETALLDLIDDFITGEKTPTMYYQFKMYNDPTLNPELYAGKK